MASRTTTATQRMAPIIPTTRPQAFNDPRWLFEPKYDGFRGMLYLTRQNCGMYSKRGNRFTRFPELCDLLRAELGRREVILDGEVIAFDLEGRINFWELMRGRGSLAYVAFDLLWYNGQDLRGLPLTERKKRLRRLIPEPTGRLSTAYTVPGRGCELFEATCRLDLEGIVAKRRADPYGEQSPWYKIKNPLYSQAEGRRKLFERHR